MDLMSKRERLAEIEDRREMMEGASGERRQMLVKMTIASILSPLFVLVFGVGAFSGMVSSDLVGGICAALFVGSLLCTPLVWIVTAVVALMSAGGAVAQSVGEERHLTRERRELLESVDATHGLTISAEEGADLGGALTRSEEMGGLSLTRNDAKE